MNAQPHKGRLPSCRKMTYMSYMHGPHMDSTQDIYFGGDGFVVRQQTAESKDAPSPPAWLIADWILAKKRGEILSNRAASVLRTETKNIGVNWLLRCVDQYDDT